MSRTHRQVAQNLYGLRLQPDCLFAVAHLSRFWVHAVRPEVGDIVRVIPNHVCVVVNMVDQLIAVRGGEIVEVLPVAARGKLV